MNTIPTAETFINKNSFLKDIFADELNKSILSEKFTEFAYCIGRLFFDLIKQL